MEPEVSSDEMTVNALRELLENIRNNASHMEDLRIQLSKVSQRKISSKKRSDKCVHCDAKVELDKLKEFVTCKGCEELACHNQKCSDFVFGLDVWECARCKKNRVIQQRAGEWLLKQLNQMKDTETPVQPRKEKISSVDDDPSLSTFVSRNQRENVRQFIEELLARMLDGPLDDVCVGQLSDDENYLQLFEKYHQKLSNLLLKLENSIHQSLVFGLPIVGAIPSNVTHQELKKFIQGVCEEVMNLPSTFDFSGIPGRKEESLPVFDPKKYEQLLATAVLNKMTDFYQNDKNSQNNSSGVHSDAELDSNHNQLNGKAVIDLMVKRDEAGQFSSTTLERLNSKAFDDETHLSDYIQNHYVPLPDLSASDSANDDVDVQSVNSSNDTDATWEDNWLFKKRKLKTENQSIAMLVPSPTEEIKALIGDKNADETSDLSENSDDDEADDDGKEKSFTNTLLIEPKKEIATIMLNPSPNDSLKSMQSLTSLDTSNPDLIVEAKNNLLLIDGGVSEPIQKINFVLSAPVTELTVTVDKPTDEEEEFNSIVSPTQIREHKKSIDEQFERLLMDDNNNHNSPSDFDVFNTPKKLDSVPSPTPAVSAEATSQNDLSDSEDWVMVPDGESISIETNTSLKCNPATPTMQKSDTFDSQTELAELARDGDESAELSPTHKRYSSPLFKELLQQPIEPIKMAKSSTILEDPISPVNVTKREAIPEDQSINILLHAASLVSKSHKTPETVYEEKLLLTPTNSPSNETNNEPDLTTNQEQLEPIEEAFDENFSKTFSVEKRPSVNDPEQVLMKNVVPGSIAEREHIKYLHAAPIANNPYSSEALQRRLSETDHKQKGFGMSNNSKIVDALVEESATSEADKEQNEEVFQAKKVDMKKYKRDYYINDPSSTSLDAEKRFSYASSTSKSPSFEVEDDHSDNIVAVSSGARGFVSRSLQTGDIDSAGDSVVSDQDVPQQEHFLSPKSAKSNDNSLTYSEDSDTTRIYNLNTRETKIVAPVEDEKVDESPIESPVKLGQKFFARQTSGIRKMDDEVTTVIRTSNRNLINGDDGSGNHVVQEAYEEKQVIEPEVIDNLPSVRKLAEIYGKDSSPTLEVQLNKPKTFLVTAEEDPAPVAQHVRVSKSSSDSFMPNYNSNYHPAMPIASITARSIPSQIRADLKKSISYDDDSIVRHGEREGSPDIQPGVTRNSIAFFENLKRH